MPNGGVPIHMVLTPSQDAKVILRCEGSELRIISKDDWDAQRDGATPLAVLTPEQGIVLERFLRYWLGDDGDGPLYRNADFDF